MEHPVGHDAKVAPEKYHLRGGTFEPLKVTECLTLKCVFYVSEIDFFD